LFDTNARLPEVAWRWCEGCRSGSPSSRSGSTSWKARWPTSTPRSSRPASRPRRTPAARTRVRISGNRLERLTVCVTRTWSSAAGSPGLGHRRIRANDPSGAILLVRAKHPPYHRPPLSKDLWVGKSTLDKLPVYDEGFYREKKVEMTLRREIVELDPESRQLWTIAGR